MLTGCGLEVEATETWHSVRGGLEGVVIGEVLSCAHHPDSTHLTLTEVSVGAENPLRIVCGAPNVAPGQKVAVATPGSSLWIGDKEVLIRKAKIRGEVSEGMICAEDELGLGTGHSGIMVLDPAAVPGTTAGTYFGVISDTIFQIGLTPNRIDAASHLGVARDLAAVINNFGKEKSPGEQRIRVQWPDLSGFRTGSQKPPVTVRVDDPDACPRYSGLTISGVKVGPSPSWLQNRLLSVGLRPINNIVDCTNFFLLETGQPLHAFDADQIAGKKVVVRKCPEGTPFVSLDGQSRILTNLDLMICSAEGPMCIAGVFGGAKSGVTESTRDVFLESACFHPLSVRRTSRHHGLQTDASYRFERGADIGITLFALKRTALLIREIAGGELSSGIVDVYPGLKEKTRITVSYPRLDGWFGTSIPEDVVKSILADLDFGIEKEDAREITLTVPTCKVDVTREADVAEEILRIYGYNNVGIPSRLQASLSFSPKPDPEPIRNLVSGYLSSTGFYEIQCNSLTRSSYYNGNPDYPETLCVRILNPLSQELDVLRQTLLFGGLESIAFNKNRQINDLKLYELGTVYRRHGKEHTSPGIPIPGYLEEQRLALFMTGRSFPETWNTPDDPVDLFGLKGTVQAILTCLSVETTHLKITPSSLSIFSRGYAYRTGEIPLLNMGFLKKPVLEPFDIRQPVLYAEADFGLLLQLVTKENLISREVPRYPEVRRDLALLLDREIQFSEIESLAFNTEKNLLQSVHLFDVYEGEQVGTGKKSYAVSFLLRSESGTLTESEIDRTMENLIQAFTRKLGASIR